MNYKWYSLTLEEIEKILRTNAALGLSRKAAHSRVRKTGGNSFFFVESKSTGSCLRSVFCDPLLLLLIGVNIVAAVFGELKVAISVGVVLLFNIIVSAFLYFKSQWIIESASGHSQPKVKVIRDGALYLADSREIVPGDILVLGEGDIIPCDCRVINSSEFKVSVYLGHNSEEKIISEPDAHAIYSPEVNLEFYEYRNTVYAGSFVLSGEARVVVTETGEHTYIGALEGGVPLNDSKARFELLEKTKKISSLYSFWALIIILVLAVVGTFTYGPDQLLNTFILSLSLGISLVGEMMLLVGNVIYAKGIYNNAVRNGNHNGGIFKTPNKTGALAGTDRLILCGTSALTDGKLKMLSVYANGQELKGKSVVSKEATRPAEYFMLLLNAVSEYPSSSAMRRIELPRDFVDYAKRLKGFTFDEFSIRPRALEFEADGTICANIGGVGNKNLISVSLNSSLLKRCNKEIINGQTVIISSERKAEILNIYKKMLLNGARPYIVTSGSFSGEILEGIFAMRSVVSERVIDSVKALKNAGVRPIVLLNSSSYENYIILKASGIIEKDNEIATASELSQNGIDIISFADKCNAFIGFSIKECKRLVQYMKKKGHTVSVYGYSYKDYDLCQAADICITCDRAEFKGTDDIEKLEVSESFGTENSSGGAQILRLKSDLLVKKASVKGGGVMGIYNSVSSARSVQKNFARAFVYLVLSQIIKFSVVIPSFLCGKTLLTAFQLLFCTLVVDLVVVWALASDRNERSMNRGFRPIEFKSPLKPIKKQIIITAVGSFVMAVAAILISFIVKANISGSVFVSVILSQLLIMFVLRDKKAPLTVELISVISVICLAVINLSLIPKLSAVTGTAFSLWSIICIPVAPAIIYVGILLTRRRASKKS